MGVEFGPLRDDAELGKLGDLFHEAFLVSPERTEKYVTHIGRENLRAVRVGGDVVGGLALMPKGQFFGGRSVPMVGIAAVTVTSGQRARGTATEMMSAMLREQYERGMALSTLYAATTPLYRRVGYEQGGLNLEVSMLTRDIDLRDRTWEVRRATAADEEAVRGVWAEFARGASGNVDRAEVNWWRVHEHRDEETEGWVVCDGGRVEGYAFVLYRPNAEGMHDLLVHDWAVTTRGAARRLVTYFADQRTMRDRVTWSAGVCDPLLAQLGETRYVTVTVKPTFMLRIVDVWRALEARGYPPGVAGEIHFEVRDDVLAGNQRRLLLTVAEGCGTVREGGEGRLVIDVRALATLYSGWRGPREVMLAGGAEMDDETAAVATRVFAGPTPWMMDMF